MRGTIYSRLAWTNIRKNRKTYLPYMVSAIGMVMMFFLTINLSMDPQVATFEEGNWMQLILRLGAIVIGLFSVIFLFYTNSFLMKRRKTELGLYHVLGMGKTHIARVLLCENLLTAIISIGVGAIGGTGAAAADDGKGHRLCVHTAATGACIQRDFVCGNFRAHLRQERD